MTLGHVDEVPPTTREAKPQSSERRGPPAVLERLWADRALGLVAAAGLAAGFALASGWLTPEVRSPPPRR